MKIAAVTMVYNEALILPYFLRHYEYLDQIHVIYETDSTDDTLQILKNTSNVTIEYGHISSGNDAIEKTELLNQAFYRIKADWVYMLDPDELIFPPNETPHDFLQRQNYDVVRAAMFQVYRHRTEKALDPSLPIIGQRLHGDPDIFSTEVRQNRACNALYIKPIVVRPSREIRFFPGKHELEGNEKISPEFYIGAHWNMASQEIAIVRRLGIKARQSERQKALGMGFQHTHVTEEWIREECARHLDDPVIQELIPVDQKKPAEIKAVCNRVFIQAAQIVELKKQLEDRENQIKDRDNQLIVKDNQIRETASQLILKDNQIKEKEDQLQEITSSITWRVAKRIHPLTGRILNPRIRKLWRIMVGKQNK